MQEAPSTLAPFEIEALTAHHPRGSALVTGILLAPIGMGIALLRTRGMPTGMALAGGLVLGVFIGALPTPATQNWAAAPEPQCARGKLTIDADGVSLCSGDDRLRAARAGVLAGFVEPSTGETASLVLHVLAESISDNDSPGGRCVEVWTVRDVPIAIAEEALVRLGCEAGRAKLEMPICSRGEAAGLLGAAVTIVVGWIATYLLFSIPSIVWPLTLESVATALLALSLACALLAFLVSYRRAPRVTVAAEGLSVTGLFGSRTILWADVDSIDSLDAAVVVRLRDGSALCLPTVSREPGAAAQPVSRALAHRMNQALQRARALHIDAPEILVRGARSTEQWVSDLCADRASYRDAGTDLETWDRVLVDPCSQPAARAAAAVAIAAHDGPAGRIRVAEARACTLDRKLAEAFADAEAGRYAESLGLLDEDTASGFAGALTPTIRRSCRS